MDIGVLHFLTDNGFSFERVRDFDLGTCQLACWDSTMASDRLAEEVVRRSEESQVRVAAFWAGWQGPTAWNFTEGPTTLGLVPEQYRAGRIAELKKWADFAAKIGAPAIVTHCGFIPENMTDPAYPGVVEAIREIADYAGQQGVGFWFETGQETPVVLLRIIEDVDLDNLGINLDPANLIMYGKGNPVDSLEVYGRYVRAVHVKDGFYPCDGRRLGREVPPGEGLVCFPLFLKRLKEIGFSGELIIEREITGEQQANDIRKTISDLETWLAAE
jgi:sugar phosphate isomerase/epimerase